MSANPPTHSSTTEIAPVDLNPTSDKPELFKDLIKKINFAVGLELSDDTLDTLRSADTFSPSINQTQSFISYHPIFLNVEVKKAYQAKDPVIPLAAWTAAEFKKRKAEGWDLGMPVLTVAISGNQWTLYVVASRKAEDVPCGYRLYFLGTCDLGSTKSMRDIRVLFDNLCDIVMWGRGGYLTWFQDHIVASCAGGSVED